MVAEWRILSDEERKTLFNIEDPPQWEGWVKQPEVE
jgi:hypothetical protein